MGKPLDYHIKWSEAVSQFSCSVMSDSATPWTAAHPASLSISNSWNLLKPMSIKSMIPSNHLIFFHPVYSFLQSFPASGSFPMSQFFASGVQSIGVSASASVLPMNIQDWFRIDWFDLLAVQGTLKRLLQHHSLKASIIWHSAFFMVQLSHPYMTTGKTIALPRRTFVGKIMSLLFNILTKFVIVFLPRSKCLKFMAAVTICSDFRAQENKISHFSHFSPSICHEVMGLDAMILVFWVQYQKQQNDLCLFPRQTIQYHSNPSLCPNH